MAITLAFDIYGTLIDTHGLLSELEQLVGDQAREFSAAWRNKQLEYSFRRGLMKDYVDFSQCTAQALDYCCLQFGCDLSTAEKQHLLAQYRYLPAFAEVAEALRLLQARQMPMFAFSNGTNKAVETLLNSAKIREYFESIISVEKVKTFKPDPQVYQHFVDVTDSLAEQCWLVSSNPFDILGAQAAGWKTAWIYRSSQQIFDPWQRQPDLQFDDLLQLAQHFIQH